MLIVFIRDYMQRSVPPVMHGKGSSMVCSQATANHFISRGAAEIVPEQEPAKEPAPERAESQPAKPHRKRRGKR